jgi:polyvinyl alcohol dehydrogenase (cytochrome)
VVAHRLRSALVATVIASLSFLAIPALIVQASTTDWLTYHRDNFRDGFNPNQAPFTSLIARWTSAHLGGTIYAEPLVVGNLVIVADEGDVVTALSATTGAIVWQRQVGNSVDTSGFNCGNIDPLGITGTPVVDPVAGIVYALAFEQPATYYLVGLDLQTGAPRFPQVAIAPSGFDPFHQQQRPALNLANGYVYAEFGGYAGDCGTYHGWVVGVPASGSGAQVVFRNDATNPGANESGFWATAGTSVDGAGNLYITSGNGSNSSTYDGGNTIYKLSPTLAMVDYWAPLDWDWMNQTDTDLGSVGPAIVGAGRNLVFQIGKSGWGYLVSTTVSSGGHSSNGLHSGKVCSAATTTTTAFDQVFGGLAYADPYIYVPCPEGIVAVQLAAGPTFSVAWTSNPHFHPGPPIVAGGVVWAVDTNSGNLYGFDPTTGAKKFGPTAIGGMTHFTTPSFGAHKLLVPSGDQVFAFGQPRSEQAGIPPVPQSPTGGRPLRPATMWYR